MQRFYSFSYLFLLPLLCVWGQQKPIHSVYCIGDAGAVSKNDSVIEQLHQVLLDADSNTTVIFLGDNIYPKGLSDSSSKTFKKEAKELDLQLSPLKKFKGKTFVLPGNHDWEKSGKNGYNYVQNQRRYVDNLLRDSTFTPFGGCPGPEEIHLTDQLVLITIDTEWMLQPIQTKTKSRCDYQSNNDLYLALNDIISRNHGKQIIVAGHHPIYTFGNHGGKFTLKDHLFPLTNFSNWAYLPLPIIGSLYPVSRQLGVNPQDINHPANKKMRQTFKKIFSQHPNLIYVAGHEHSLQYSYKDSVNYIVSGSGCKTTHLNKKKLDFGVSELGYAKLDYYDDKVNFSFKGIDTTYYSKSIKHKTSHLAKQNLKIELTDSITIKASELYGNTSKNKKNWLGENYRAEWSTPIKVPIFNISEEKGGLKIIKRGGGMATLSLRLQDSLGNQYALRSIDKNTQAAVPEELRNTIAKDIVQDQTSASHPYAAIVVPPMADAIKIYHTNPKIVYIPDDENFGVYRQIVAGKLFLFEERPSKNDGNIGSFGNAKKIISTPKVIDKLKEDNDNTIDYKFTLRSRLFDMLIGDWDRHDDQWRWATFKGQYGKLYRPIPRDRDQVFFVNQGILPKIASRKWILPKFEGFSENINWAEGFNFNARYFDRYFLSQATQQDWINEAKNIQTLLTDSIIEQAIKSFPDTIYALHGKQIAQTLKARKKVLVDIAKRHYRALAKSVTILGTDKTEQFIINHNDLNQTEVSVYKISKKGNIKQRLYHRLFLPKETNEIRIYGLLGDDQFVIKGKGKAKIKIRVIGGNGQESIADSVTTKGKKTIVYDIQGQVDFLAEKNIKKRISKKPSVNFYERKAYRYNTTFPLLYAGYTPDDGVLIGGGFIRTTHSFRKSPYATRQQLIGGVSFLTGAFKIKYQLDITEVLGKTNLELIADLQSPRNSNYYGKGNESKYDSNEKHRYYRFNYSDYRVEPLLKWSSINNKNILKIGPVYRQTHVDKDRFTSGDYISTTDWDLDTQDPYGTQNYVGLTAKYELDTRDNVLVPKKGMKFSSESYLLNRLNSNFANFFNVSGEFSAYKTIKLPRDLTFGIRAGGAHNIGDFHYLLSNKIGGKNTLRGYRRDRYYGKSSVYNSIEVRYDLYNIKTIIFPFTIGMIAFNDIGRVWTDEESSQLWHNSFGGGLYVKPVNAFAVSIQLAKSNELLAFYFDLGFSF